VRAADPNQFRFHAVFRRRNGDPRLALVSKDRNVKGMDVVMPEVQGNRIVESKTEARQGVTGHNVRYVLGFGVAAVIVLFVIVYIFYFG